MAILTSLSKFHGHAPVASPLKQNFLYSYSCASLGKIPTDMASLHSSCAVTELLVSFKLTLFRRSVRIQDNELRDLAQKIRQANKLKECEDSELSMVSEHHYAFDW